MKRASRSIVIPIPPWRERSDFETPVESIRLQKPEDLLLFVFNNKQQMLPYAQHDRYPFSST
jgi:hypothetical protein